MGKFGYGKRNERGWRLLRFCQEKNLKIINTFFKKRLGKRWSWITPNLEHKTLIDYIITIKNNKTIINYEFQGTNKFEYYTDHRLLKVIIKTQKIFNRNKSNKVSVKTLEPNKYLIALKEQLDKIDSESKQSINTFYGKIIEATQKAASISEEQEIKETEREDDGIRNLQKKRAKLLKIKTKSKTEKIELNLISKLIRNKLRQKIDSNNNEIIKQTLEGNKNIRAMNKKLSKGVQWTTFFTGPGEEKICDRKNINAHITEFYKKLYNESGIENAEIAHSGSISGEAEQPTEPNFLKEEVNHIIKYSKKKVSPGHDHITNEMVKLGGEVMIEILTELFNKILAGGKVPDEWRKSDIIILFKKGDRHKVENYRPINLSVTISKIFSKLIETRIQTYLNIQQPAEQAGFRKKFSTIDHLHTMNQIIEKCLEFQLDLYIALIDFSKAFDSIIHEYMWMALKNQGVPTKYIEIIRDMYRGLKARIKTEIEGEYFEIRRGVKQGDPLSPVLFNCALEEIFKKMNWNNEGLIINGERFTNLRFADDVALLSSCITELEIMIKDLTKEGMESGLRMNIEKTKILTKNTFTNEVIINDKTSNPVHEATYLGQNLSFENRTEKEVNIRISKTWAKFWSLKNIFKGPFKNSQKSQIFNMCIVPSLTYGCQTWTLTSKIIKKLETTQNSIERSILNFKKKDRKKLKTIKSLLKENTDVVKYVRRQKWRWAGHVARMKDDRWTYKSTFWFLSHFKRKKGRQLARWEDDINAFLGGRNFQRVANDRREWDRLQETFAHFGPRIAMLS
jgi:hypothetical protein